MKMEELVGLQEGDFLVVKFGAKGTQQARFVKYAPKTIVLIVDRYSASSRRWKTNLRVTPDEVISVDRLSTKLGYRK